MLKDKLPAIAFILLLVLITGFYRTYLHEGSHAEIYEKYDCYNITVDYNFIDASTASAMCSLTDEELLSLKESQSMVESKYSDATTDLLLIIIITILLFNF